MSARVLVVEGVPYQRFRVTFRLSDGRRRSWVRWSPGRPWIGEEVSRELQDRFTREELPARSAIRIEEL